jgi:hypothetical protein
MKIKNLLLLSMGCIVIAAGAKAKVVLPETVQGVPYAQSIKQYAKSSVESADFANPQPMSVDKSKFTFDMIKSWAGKGSNKSGVVIQWNCGKDNVALAFGYRWDEACNGNELLSAVAQANPQLYIVADNTSYGMTIYGIGWDADCAGKIGVKDASGNVYEADETGVIYISGYGKADELTPLDENDYWQSGWYSKGYWSYWTSATDLNSFTYSNVGASSRKLTDGSWDGWTFRPSFAQKDWFEIEAAPNPRPDDVKTEFKTDGLYYKVKNYLRKTVSVEAPMELEGEELTEYTGAITIPATVKCDDNEYNVVAIDDAAFEGSEITSVSLPTSVETIGSLTFESCAALTSINTENVTSIGSYAFMGCASLSEVALNANITSIAEGTFYGSGIKSANLHEGVTSIGASAYEACTALESVVFPTTLKTVGDGAFAESTAITSIKANTTVPYTLPEGCFASEIYNTATVSVPVGYTATYQAATEWKNFTNYDEFLLDVAVADNFIYSNVNFKITSLGEDNTVKISYCTPDGAATATNIKAANLAGYVGDIVIPDEVEYQNIKLKVTELGDSAFYNAQKLTSVKLPSTLTSIPKSAFSMCSALTSVNIPETVTTIGEYAFYQCKALESIEIPAKVETIGKYAFYYDEKLTSITLPESLTSLGDDVFYNCTALKSINIPAGVTAIPNYAFDKCYALSNIELGDQITSLGSYAFADCTTLTSVKLPSTIKELPASCFNGCISLESLEIPETVVKFGNSLFKGCTKLNIDVPAQITSLGTNVFDGCTSLTKANIPDAITVLPTNTFNNCISLEEVTISDAITSLGNYAFANCKALKSLNISKASKAMKAAEENGKSINLPSALTSIGNYAFSAVGLSEIELPATLKTIGTYAFQNNPALTTIVLPASMTSMSSNYMFYGCSNLTVYILNPTPVATATNAFKSSSSAYVKVVVPTGTTAAYVAKSKYWSSVGLTEPEVSVAFNKSADNVVSDVAATLSAAVSFSYAEDVPEAFVEANNNHLATDAVVSVAYAPKGELSETSATVTAVVGEDGSYTAAISELEAATTYNYQWSYAGNGATYTSEVGEFTTNVSAGVADINAAQQAISYVGGVLSVIGGAGNSYSVASVTGAVCATFVSLADNYEYQLALTPGIYIVRNNTTGISAKILVK